MEKYNQFTKELSQRIWGLYVTKQLIKVVFTQYKGNLDLKSMFLRPVELKKKWAIQVTFRHKTKDIFKNYKTKEELFDFIKEYLLCFNQFLIQGKEIQVEGSLKKGEWMVQEKKDIIEKDISYSHDQKKNYLISSEKSFLYHLGVCSTGGHVIPSQQDKFKQINKYAEIMLQELSQLTKLKSSVSIVDMGSGKGYLTFALQEIASSNFGANVHITGIELRPELVTFCNDVVEKLGINNLNFHSLPIEKFEGHMDVLIALHACDTATDYAIAQGIRKEADLIVVAPCCHKQVRKHMQVPGSLMQSLSQGILLERQAEWLTDAIRSLILRLNGYKTKVFEFISAEHTPKNVMIVAHKEKQTEEQINKSRAEISYLKQMFGLEKHFLEELLPDISL